MSQRYGWSGLILDIDLSTRQVIKRELPKQLTDQYLGGRGINGKILYDEVKPGTDPLGPENVLILGTGPVTGGLGAAGRFNATALSPMTGIFGDGNCGGQWAPELKWAGYDHLVVRGRADEPVYVLIEDDRVEIRSARALWGKNVWETTKLIRAEVGDPELEVAAIGQAGENLVRFACIIASFSRAPGRCGLGAVMGSKNLKAVAVRGRKGVRVADPDGYLRVYRALLDKILAAPQYKYYPVYGTPILVETLGAMGLRPVKNFNQSEMPGIEEIGGAAFVQKWVAKSRACFGCPIHCDHFCEVKEGPLKGTRGPGLEYEAVSAFALRLGHNDYPTAILANNLSSQYGLDVVSAGAAISLAMELFEKGIITEADTGGIPIRWGDKELVIKLIHMMTHKEGFGELLAEGPYWMAQRIGRGADRFVVHMKKLDNTAVEVRGYKGLALGHHTSTRGGDHLRGNPRTEQGHFRGIVPEIAINKFGSKDVVVPHAYDTVGKPRATAWYQHFAAVVDCMEMCKFNTFWTGYPIEFPEFAQFLKTLTGDDFDVEQLLTIGERVVNTERAFNARLGQTRDDDQPCYRMANEELPDGPMKGQKIDVEAFNKMLDAYYQVRGWDQRGIPTPAKLHSLGLSDIAWDMAEL